MDYWHEIVRKYDKHGSIAPNKRNDATYSQSSVVILLLYLTFGSDHPYNIMNYFKDPYIPINPDAKVPYSSNLNTTKIYTLLKKMEEDQLVTITQHKVGLKVKKVYSINLQVIQSPIRGGGYVKDDGSPFEIPLEIIKQFLPWRDLHWEELEPWSGRNGFFSHVVYPDRNFDFVFFLKVLDALARDRMWDMDHDRGLLEPFTFGLLLKEYENEIEAYDYENGNPPRDFVNPFRRK